MEYTPAIGWPGLADCLFFSNVVSFEGQGIARLQELQTEKIGNTEIR